MPYETLVERLQPARDQSRNPLFTIAFTLLAAATTARPFAGLTVTPLRTAASSRFDFEVVITEGSEGPTVVFTYNTTLFEAGTAERLARHFQTLLAAIADNMLDRELGRHLAMHCSVLFRVFLDGKLALRPCVAGARYSVADITAVVAVDFMKPAKIAVPDNLTNVKRWHADISARPSAKA